jgi:uncharacterized protein (DUF1499 family)
MGIFTGNRPATLGVKDGRFAPVGWKPNHVCSQAEPTDKIHYVKAFEVQPKEDPLDIWEALVAHIKSLPRCTIIVEKRNYVHAEFTSARLGFVDDLELYLPPPMACIHVRSAARIGVRDFGINRARVEAIRKAVMK